MVNGVWSILRTDWHPEISSATDIVASITLYNKWCIENKVLIFLKIFLVPILAVLWYFGRIGRFWALLAVLGLFWLFRGNLVCFGAFEGIWAEVRLFWSISGHLGHLRGIS